MNQESDTYSVLDAPSKAVIKVKGSRFIAEALPVSTVEQAEAALAAIRKRDYSATHHCSAYRIGPEGSVFRYSDDSEPNATAGQPILRQIEGRQLTNTMVVVTRYYGGTKLGTGGLIRAYGDAASAALSEAAVREVIPRSRLAFTFSYQDTSAAMHTISRHDAITLGTTYGDDTTIELDIRTREIDSFEDAVKEALSGRGRISRS